MRLISTVLLLAATVLLVLIYHGGLTGGFLFDDYANLPALGRYGPIVDVDGLLRYLTSGIADATGRPIAALSFLLDANTWPADPWPFKRTNLTIHVINFLLLYQVLRKLSAFLPQPPDRMHLAALLGAALWAVHPLWVSTVLYVVQRHALLATTFVLLGILVWILAQESFNAGRPRRGWALSLVAVALCGTLAGLSKPNGFLLPLLLLALSPLLNRGRGVSPARFSWTRPDLWLLLVPSLLIVVGLVYAAATADWSVRPWRLSERLLTEPRALLDYAGLLAVPTAYSKGVFADGFVVSRSLLDPPVTLLALAALLAALVAAIAGRKRHPAMASALLFYFAGHVLESTVVPLELYFEHRNYLPSALLFWPLAIVLCSAGPAYVWRRLAAAVLLAVMATVTLARTSLWGDPLRAALVWARDNPTSARAQTHAANQLVASGRADLAVALLAPLLEKNPYEPQYALAFMDARCHQGQVSRRLLDATARLLAHEGVTADVTHQWLVGALQESRASSCRGLPVAELEMLVEAARSGPRQSDEVQSRLLRIEGYLAIRLGRCDEALTDFNQRLDIERRPESTQEQVLFLATRCTPDHALRHLRHYQAGAARGDEVPNTLVLRMRDALMRRQGYWETEFRRLESVLQADIASGNSGK